MKCVIWDRIEERLVRWNCLYDFGILNGAFICFVFYNSMFILVRAYTNSTVPMGVRVGRGIHRMK